MLCANIDILRPQFAASVFKYRKIRSKPAGITKIQHIKKVAPLINIIKTEDSNVSASVERSNPFNVLSRK